MCFTYVDTYNLHKYIESKLFKKIFIQFIAKYSSKQEHWVQLYTDGIYRNRLIKMPLRDAEEIGNLYRYLFKKYGFTNILGFL